MRSSVLIVGMVIAVLAAWFLAVAGSNEPVVDQARSDPLADELAERDAQLAALQRKIAELERAAAAAAMGAAPPRAPARGASTAGRKEAEPAPARADAGTVPVVAWLRALDPERFAGLTPAGLAAIAALELRGTAVTDGDLVHLGALPALTAVSLRGTAVTDAGMRHLTGLVGLESLSLRDTAVTAAGLAFLPSRLRALDLTGTPAGALHTLPALQELGTLKVNRLPLADDGLLALARCPALSHLELDGTQVTAQGLRDLAERHPGLRRLEVRGLGVSPELASELQRRRPGLVVVADDPAWAFGR